VNNLAMTAGAAIDVKTDVTTVASTSGTDTTISELNDLVIGSVDANVPETGVTANDGSVVVVARGLTVNQAVEAKGAGKNVTLESEEMEIAANVRAEGDRVTLRSKASVKINLGSETAALNTLHLTDMELDRVTAGVLQIEAGALGGIEVTDAISPDGTNTLHLVAPSAAISGAGRITETNLALTANSGIDVNTAVGTVAATNSSSGGVVIRETDDIVVGSVDGETGITSTNGAIDIATAGSKITVNEALSATGGDVRLDSDEIEVNVGGAMASGNLEMDADLAVDINDSIEAGGSIRIDTPGMIRFGKDATSVTAGSDLELNANIDQADILDPTIATIAKAEGGLTLTAQSGDFAMGRAGDQNKRGQKLTAVGPLEIKAGGTAFVGDLNGQESITVDAPHIVLLRRPAGESLGPDGNLISDGGVDYVADDIILSSPATTAGSAGAVTFSTESGNPVANAPDGSLFARNEGGPLTPESFSGPNEEVLDLVAGKVNPPDNADVVPQIPEEVNLRASLLSQINQVAARKRPYWASEAVRAIECVMFEGEAIEDIPEECLDFVAVEEGQEVDPRLELEPLQNARQIYKELFENEDDVVDSLQRAANAYTASVPAGAASGKGFRQFVERDRSHAAAVDYLDQFAALFRAYDELGEAVEAGAGELDEQREDLVGLFGPVGLSAEEFNAAIEASAGKAQGEGTLLASDGLPRSLRATP
jgi:hypothetical protein